MNGNKQRNWVFKVLLFFFAISLPNLGLAQTNHQVPNVAELGGKHLKETRHHLSIDDEAVTPETWKSIRLEIPKADGSIAKIDLLRPTWWLADAHAKVGGTIPLSIAEIGIEGNATVVNIGTCKADSRNIKVGTRIVTGKFTHENAVVLDLYFNNTPSHPLGVTPNHPLYSASRNTWVVAGELKIGEQVKTKDGIAKLTLRQQRPGRHKVYNFEVHKDHNYYVSNLGILAHNDCAGKAYSHDLKYADRVRARGVQDPKSHNFPYSFDDGILATKPIPKKNGYNMFQKRGTMNGKEGVFEIGVTKDGIIDHRFFRPDK